MFLDFQRDRGFFCYDKAAAHGYCLCTEGQGSKQPSPVADSACGHHRYFYFAYHQRYEYGCGYVTGMPSGFRTLDDDGIGAILFRPYGVPQCTHGRQINDSVWPCPRDDFFGIAYAVTGNTDLFFDDDIEQFIDFRVVCHEIHTEWFVG